MKLILISDTHEQHDQVKIPEGDVLIHSGDFTNQGDIYAIEKFVKWFGSQKPKYKLLCYGNHELGTEFGAKREKALKLFKDEGIIYLEDSSVVIDGIKFYGSPIQPFFFNWEWNRQRGAEIKKHWDKIEEDTNILFTHGPAFNRLDQTPSGEKVGCKDLLNRISELRQLKLHVCGHIHHSYGQIEIDKVKFVNASVCNEKYKPINLPIIVEI